MPNPRLIHMKKARSGNNTPQMCLTVGLPFSFDLLDTILVKMGAPCDLWSIAAVCKEWENVTKDVRDYLKTACSKLVDEPFLIATPLTKTNVSFYDKEIGEDGAVTFAAAIQPMEGSKGALPRLSTLYLGWNNIGDSGLTSLATALGSGALPSLTVLNLTRNQMGDIGVTALASALGKGALPSLRGLNLGYNKIGDDGVIALATALANGTLPNLEVLVLSHNKIGDSGLSSFATVLGSGALSLLTELWLNNNQIGDSGLTSLANALGKGVLELGGNKIGDVGVISLAGAMGALASLKDLRMYKTAPALEAACEARGITYH